MDININKIIERFQLSKKYKWFRYGDDYYEAENTVIMARKKQFFHPATQKMVDHPYAANNRLPSSFFALLVDQKVSFLLGNGITLDGIDTEQLDPHFEGDFNVFIQDVATTASKKRVGWVHPYYDEETNELQFIEIPPEQLIPFYDSKKRLAKAIRIYKSEDEKFEPIIVAEIWDDKEMSKYYRKDDDEEAEWVFDSKVFHITNLSSDSFSGKILDEESHGWGKVPFIPLYNNNVDISDLKRIKPFIDIYDIVNSDFANNIEDFQEAFFVIKNYQGSEAAEFLEQLKYFKNVKVGTNGGVDVKQLQIPTEARKVFLDKVTMDIYKFGMGVDTDQLAGGSITNVLIKAMFANLDLKSKTFEKQVNKFLKEIGWFIKEAKGIDIGTKFKYTRSLIVNEVELLKANTEQSGSVSEETRLTNHPWVTDVMKEMEKMEEEEAARIEKFGANPFGFDESGNPNDDGESPQNQQASTENEE